MEQTMRPIPLKYTLDTTFVLSNNPDAAATQPKGPEEPESQFDGYFRRGESLYGRVMWNGNRNGEKPSYKLELEKIYICQSHSKEFLPFFDPDGEIFNKGPLFGCSNPHKSLKHRILALDKISHLTSLQTTFIEQQSKTADGFVLRIDQLFDLMNETESITSLEEQPWFIQVMYVISVGNSSITKRSASVYSLNNIYNNGTNMQTIKLTNKPAKYFEKIFQKNKQMRTEVFSFREVFVKFLLPIFILIVFILFTTITLIFYRKSITKNKFWTIRLTKKKLAEFPNPIASAQQVTEKDIYDNYENLMGMKQGKASGQILKLQSLFNSSKLYSKRVKNKAFRKVDTIENVSNSNSTSGTLIAAPLLENNSEHNMLSKLFTLLL